MILLPSHKLAIDDLIALITDETVQRFDHCAEVQTLRYWVNPVLALRRPIVVIGAFEDETQTLRHEPHLCSLAPAEQVQCDLSEPVVLAHVVHCLTPSFLSSEERLFVSCTSSTWATFFDRFQTIESGVLGVADCVIKV
jgi:hypothetical protein